MKDLTLLPLFSKWMALLFFLSFVQSVSNAQITQPEIFVESIMKAGVGEIPPFYSVSNQYGIFSREKNAILLRSGIISSIDTAKNLSLAFGLDAIYRYDSNSDLWLQQAFVKVKVYFIIFQGGYIEETFGNQDNQLSSGGYLFSGNARPIPKIAMHTNDYINIPFTNNLLQLKAGISHGWFGEKEQYIRNAYLHHKYFFLRIGHNKLPFSINMGIQHAAVWGGTSPVHGKLPSDWNAYKSVFKARMKGNVGPETEQENLLGNHLGSYSLGVETKFKRHELNLYWQTILEDKNGRVGVDWKNKGDGLWGIAIAPVNKDNGIKKIVFEFFNSTSQSGDTAHSGNDDYFNNGLYRSGWTYHEMTIGTPLITSPAFTNRSPEMDTYLENNCVRALSAGLLYEINERQFMLKMIYSRNYGTIIIPYTTPRDQFYSALAFTYPSKRFRNLLFSWQAAFDIGNHLGNNAGFMVKARKTF
jgi:hypothetical protein